MFHETSSFIALLATSCLWLVGTYVVLTLAHIAMQSVMRAVDRVTTRKSKH